MRKYLLILLFITLIDAKAYCPPHVIDTYPSSEGKIVRDQIFIFFLTNLPFIENLSWNEDGSINSEDSKKIRFLLASKTHVTETIILKKFRGESRHNQFLVLPKELLLTNEKYFLKIKIYQSKTEKYEVFPLNYEYSWTTNDELHQRSAQLASLAPKFIGGEYFKWECGPHKTANFKFPFMNDQIVISELIDSTELTRKFSMGVIQKGEIAIGRGMCGGAIEFKRKHQYKIRFNAINNLGELSDYGDFVSFKSP